MTQPRLKHFGWGREGEGLTPAELLSCSAAWKRGSVRPPW